MELNLNLRDSYTLFFLFYEFKLKNEYDKFTKDIKIKINKING